MTSIKVEYERSLRDARVAGSVVITVADDADLGREWGIAYATLKSQVDLAADLQAPVTVEASPSDQSPSSAPIEDSSPSSATPEVSQAPATVTPNTPVEYTRCRVMFNPNEYPARGRGKAHVRLRIANSEQIPVGTPQGKVNAKSSEPSVMAQLRQFREGDFVNVKGYFEEPWQKRRAQNSEDGSNETVEEWDLVVESIART